MAVTQEALEKILTQFSLNVLSQARANFKPKNVTRKGISSLNYDVTVGPSSFALHFSMEDYMHYQDKGVSGVKVKYNTPFSYKTKMPPPRVFDGWVVRRGLAPRTAKGAFMKRKSLTFALSRKIFTHGIRPSLFFTQAFEHYYKELPQELLDTYALEVENFLKFTTKK